MDASTVIALQNRRTGSLRKLAQELGFPPSFAGTLSDIFNGRAGHVSTETENRLRVALGMAAVHMYTVPACPSCGGVHTGDCCGRPVAQVVTLAPGEGVRRARRTPSCPVAFAGLRRLASCAGPRYYNNRGRRVDGHGWEAA